MEIVMAEEVKCSNLKKLDPVQGLVDYVNDIKPYHTKIVEVLVEYVHNEIVDVSISDKLHTSVEIFRPPPPKMGVTCPAGYNSSFYGGPVLPIISPNPSIQFENYPAMGSNFFILPGDQTTQFPPGSEVFVRTWIEDYSNLYNIVGIQPGSGGLGYFDVYDPTGNIVNLYVVGDVVATSQLVDDEGKLFTVTTIPYNVAPDVYRIEVQGTVSSYIPMGKFGTKIIALGTNDNTGVYTVTHTEYHEGMIDSWPGYPDTQTPNYIIGDDPHTKVYVEESINPIPSLTTTEAYVGLVTHHSLNIVNLLSYSNNYKYYDANVPSIMQTPDEGFSYYDIEGVTVSSYNNGIPIPNTGAFVILGDIKQSNIFIGDSFRVLNSTGNNGTYTITSLVYDNVSNQTTITVNEEVRDPLSDGIVRFDVPANVFIVNGNHTSRFKQGYKFDVVGGSVSGTYTTVSSDYVNSQTRVRVSDSIIEHSEGFNIIETTSLGFVVAGDITSSLGVGSTFNIVKSTINNGAFTVNSINYDSVLDKTVILPNESFELVSDGIIIPINLGQIKDHYYGFGGEPGLCDLTSEGHLHVLIQENVKFNQISIDVEDDLIVHNMENNKNGAYDLPLMTIVSPTPPSIPEQLTPPIPSQVGDLWFDTTTATLKGWNGITWKYVSRGWWFDTSSNLLHYRHKDSIIDTNWVLFLAEPPGFNDIQPAIGKKYPSDYEVFNVNSNNNNIFTLTNFSVVDSNLVRAYVNGVPASFNLITSTEIEILSPVVFLNDIVTIVKWEDDRVETNANVNDYNSIPHQKFHNNVINDNGVYVLPGGNYVSRMTPDRVIKVYDLNTVGFLVEDRPDSFQILSVDSTTNAVTIANDLTNFFVSGRIANIQYSKNNTRELLVASSAYDSITNITTITFDNNTPVLESGIVPDASQDLGTLLGAVFDPIVDLTNPNDQIKTLLKVKNPQISVTSISYEWIGPIQFVIGLNQTDSLHTSMLDYVGISNEAIERSMRLPIVASDSTQNTVSVYFEDLLQPGTPVSLEDSFTRGTIFTITESYDNTTGETNNAKYVVSDASFDGTNTIITIETDYANIPPYYTFDVISIDESNQTITFNGNLGGLVSQYNLINAVVYIDQPLISTNPLYNTLTINNVSYTSSSTTFTVEEPFINASYTGPLGMIKTEFRGSIMFDNLDEEGFVIREGMRIEQTSDNAVTASFTEDFTFSWGSTERWKIIDTDGSNQQLKIESNTASLVDVGDTVKIEQSASNDGTYTVTNVSYDAVADQTTVTLDSIIQDDPPNELGILVLENVDVSDWYQYLIEEANATTNTFTVFGDARQDIQQNQQFRVMGTSNDGIYTAIAPLVYNGVLNTTDIVVSNITNDEVGGWVESYRDYGIRMVFEDYVGVTITEQSSALLLNSGTLIGAFDYNYLDIGSLDESIGTVIHLYGNSF